MILNSFNDPSEINNNTRSHGQQPKTTHTETSRRRKNKKKPSYPNPGAPSQNHKGKKSSDSSQFPQVHSPAVDGADTQHKVDGKSPGRGLLKYYVRIRRSGQVSQGSHSKRAAAESTDKAGCVLLQRGDSHDTKSAMPPNQMKGSN
jgi:hypothetical protein